jgi:hypothetical protein
MVILNVHHGVVGSTISSGIFFLLLRLLVVAWAIANFTITFQTSFEGRGSEIRGGGGPHVG